MKTACDYVKGLRYKLRMMGIRVDEPTYIYGDNQSVLANTSNPGSTLKKKSSAIAYHFVREGCVKDEWRTTISKPTIMWLIYSPRRYLRESSAGNSYRSYLPMWHQSNSTNKVLPNAVVPPVSVLVHFSFFDYTHVRERSDTGLVQCDILVRKRFAILFFLKGGSF